MPQRWKRGSACHGLDHRRIAGEAAEIHSGAECEARKDSGHHPAQREERCRDAQGPERGRSSDDALESLRILEDVLEYDETAEAVAEEEDRQSGLFGPDYSEKPAQILPEHAPAGDVTSLSRVTGRSP